MPSRPIALSIRCYQFVLGRIHESTNKRRIQIKRNHAVGQAARHQAAHRAANHPLVAEFPLDRIIEAIAQAHRPGKVLIRCTSPR